jgi:hypothetical protein
MSAFARLNELDHPRPLWIVLLAVTFWFSWPIALGLFVILLWSGRLDGWKRAGLHLWEEGMGPMRQPGNWWSPQSSGNHAFDRYRSDTLRRLEDEEKEFRDFLNRLRAAKDKTEFDQFMAERRGQAANPAASPQS